MTTHKILAFTEPGLKPKMPEAGESRERVQFLEEEVARLRTELREARRQLVELADLADQDALTGIMNRRALVRELTRVLSAVERYGFEAHFVYADLNGLKNINDNHGHGAGDAVLKHIGEVLAGNIRQTDAVGRIGGDEFGLLLTHTSREMAELKMDQLARRLSAQPVVWNKCALTISLSYGVRTLEPGLIVENILHEADEAMYRDKNRRKQK